MNKVFGFLLGIAVLLTMPALVSAQNCTDIMFNVPESGIVNGLFKVSVSTNSGTPEDPWGNYTNATLSLEPELVNMSSLFVDLQTVLEAAHNWGVNGTGLGNYDVNVTFSEDGGNTCTLSDSINIQTPSDPYVIVGPLMHVPQRELEPFDLNITLANSGTGTAYNLTLDIEMPGFNQSNNLSDLGVGDIETRLFTATPSVCGTQSIWVQASYRNSVGEEMPSSYATDSFEVVGSDLMVEVLNGNTNSTPVGSTLTLTTRVKNLGQYNSSGYTLTFYKGDPANNTPIGTLVSVTGLGEQESEETQFNWTVDEVGIYRIYAIVSGSNECTVDENNEEWFEVTGTADCGDGYCNGGESCSTCPGDCGSCSSPPGGTSPGGGRIYSPSSGSWSPSCNVNWSCTDWGVCSSFGIQTRTCTDLNECGTDNDKPEENMSCAYVPPVTEKVCNPGEIKCTGDKLIFCASDGRGWGLAEDCKYGCSEGKCLENVEKPILSLGDMTGFVVANSSYIGGGVIVILILAGVYLYLMKNKKWEGWESQSAGLPKGPPQRSFEPRSGAFSPSTSTAKVSGPEAPILDQSRTASQEQRNGLARRPSLDRIKELID